jgi:hypothetical protein
MRACGLRLALPSSHSVDLSSQAIICVAILEIRLQQGEEGVVGILHAQS